MGRLNLRRPSILIIVVGVAGTGATASNVACGRLMARYPITGTVFQNQGVFEDIQRTTAEIVIGESSNAPGMLF